MGISEVEIDARVAHLYGLSGEGYPLVLCELKLPDPFRVVEKFLSVKDKLVCGTEIWDEAYFVETMG